jgi:hypothetical protein
MSNTKLIHTRLQENTQSSFKDKNGNYYVIIKDGTVLPLESEDATNFLLRTLIDIQISRKKYIIKEFLFDYLKPITTETRSIFNRVGISFNEQRHVQNLYIKLNQLEIVQVSEDIWSIVNNADIPNIFFVTTTSKADMPTPQKDGNVEMLKELINFSSEDDFKLVLV